MAGRRESGRQARRIGWRPWAVLALCWLLAVQTMLAGPTVAGHPTAGEPGTLTSVICTPDGLLPAPADGPTDAPARGRATHDMSCCLLGCGNTGPGLAPPPAVAVVLPAGPSTDLRPALPADRQVAALRHSPRSTRAPPTTV